MISFSTRIFTKTKCQVSLVVQYINAASYHNFSCEHDSYALFVIIIISFDDHVLMTPFTRNVLPISLNAENFLCVCKYEIYTKINRRENVGLKSLTKNTGFNTE